MTQALPTLAMAAVLSLASATSHATLTAQASLASLQITLIDLDPNDGITPAITFEGGGLLRLSSTRPDYSGGPFLQTTPAIGTAGSLSLNNDLHSGTATVSAGNLLLAGSGPSAAFSYQGDGYGSLGGEASPVYSRFSLTANTRIEITGYASGSISTLDANHGLYAGANLHLFQLDSQDNLVADLDGAYFSFVLGQGYTTTDTPRTLAVAYSNGSSQPMQATLYAGAYAGSWATAAAPVPEPATGLQILLGLTAIAAWARRGCAPR